MMKKFRLISNKNEQNKSIHVNGAKSLFFLFTGVKTARSSAKMRSSSLAVMILYYGIRYWREAHSAAPCAAEHT